MVSLSEEATETPMMRLPLLSHSAVKFEAKRCTTSERALGPVAPLSAFPQARPHSKRDTTAGTAARPVHHHTTTTPATTTTPPTRCHICRYLSTPHLVASCQRCRGLASVHSHILAKSSQFAAVLTVSCHN